MNRPNRHLTRQAVFQALFESDFRDNDPLANFNRLLDEVDGDLDDEYGQNLINAVIEHQDIIDERLLEAAPDWPIEKVAKVDKSVLRLAIAELLYSEEVNNVPGRVAINEAVELAKKFGSTNSSRFVNGVLGTIYRKYVENTNGEPKEVAK